MLNRFFGQHTPSEFNGGKEKNDPKKSVPKRLPGARQRACSSIFILKHDVGFMRSGLLQRAADMACILSLCFAVCGLFEIASAQSGASPQKQKKVTPRAGMPLYDSIKQEDRGGSIAMPFRTDRSVTVADIKELTRRSSDIIVGRPLRSKCFLNNGGDDIYSVDLIQVQTVIKGKIINGSVVELQTAGGAWMYPDGTRVVRFPTDARLLRQDASYFIFMKREGPDKHEWMPALGIQSIFELDGDTQSVNPCDLVETDPVVKKYKNASIAEFVSEIVAAVASEESGKRR
jgi:hypothetical protein